MISSADYWATVFVIVSFAAMVYATRRTQRQIQKDRAASVHAATVRSLGDGRRVVVSVECSGSPRYRVSIESRVWGFANWAAVVAFLDLVAVERTGRELDGLEVHAAQAGGVALHHPSLRSGK